MSGIKSGQFPYLFNLNCETGFTSDIFVDVDSQPFDSVKSVYLDVLSVNLWKSKDLNEFRESRLVGDSSGYFGGNHFSGFKCSSSRDDDEMNSGAHVNESTSIQNEDLLDLWKMQQEFVKNRIAKFMSAKQYSSAKIYLNKLLHDMKCEFGSNSLPVMQISRFLGNVHLAEHDLSSAKVFLSESLEMSELLDLPLDCEILRCMSDLAVVQLALGVPDEEIGRLLEKLRDRVYKVEDRSLHMQYFTFIQSFIYDCFCNEACQVGSMWMNEGLEFAETFFGTSSFQYAEAFNSRASIYDDLGDIQAFLMDVKAAVRIYAGQMSQEYAGLSLSRLMVRGLEMMQRKEFPLAEFIYREALSLSESAPSLETHHSVMSYMAIAKINVLKNDFAMALYYYEQALCLIQTCSLETEWIHVDVLKGLMQVHRQLFDERSADKIQIRIQNWESKIRFLQNHKAIDE